MSADAGCGGTCLQSQNLEGWGSVLGVQDTLQSSRRKTVKQGVGRPEQDTEEGERTSHFETYYQATIIQKCGVSKSINK